MITISSENNLLSKVLAMILLFILPSNLYRTPIPHKLGLFCRNLAFLTCDWQYLVWRRFVLLLPCPKKSDKMWTLSESVVQKESFPSARCLRQKAERGRAGFKRGGGGEGIELSEASHWSTPSFRSICSLRERLRCTARQTSPRFCDFQKLPLMESFAPFVCICGTLSTPFPL